MIAIDRCKMCQQDFVCRVRSVEDAARYDAWCGACNATLAALKHEQGARHMRAVAEKRRESQARSIVRAQNYARVPRAAAAIVPLPLGEALRLSNYDDHAEGGDGSSGLTRPGSWEWALASSRRARERLNELGFYPFNDPDAGHRVIWRRK
jgi:hypothetical protein